MAKSTDQVHQSPFPTWGAAAPWLACFYPCSSTYRPTVATGLPASLIASLVRALDLGHLLEGSLGAVIQQSTSPSSKS